MHRAAPNTTGRGDRLVDEGDHRPLWTRTQPATSPSVAPSAVAARDRPVGDRGERVALGVQLRDAAVAPHPRSVVGAAFQGGIAGPTRRSRSDSGPASLGGDVDAEEVDATLLLDRNVLADCGRPSHRERCSHAAFTALRRSAANRGRGSEADGQFTLRPEEYWRKSQRSLGDACRRSRQVVAERVHSSGDRTDGLPIRGTLENLDRRHYRIGRDRLPVTGWPRTSRRTGSGRGQLQAHVVAADSSKIRAPSIDRLARPTPTAKIRGYVRVDACDPIAEGCPACTSSAR